MSTWRHFPSSWPVGTWGLLLATTRHWERGGRCSIPGGRAVSTHPLPPHTCLSGSEGGPPLLPPTAQICTEEKRMRLKCVWRFCRRVCEELTCVLTAIEGVLSCHVKPTLPIETRCARCVRRMTGFQQTFPLYLFMWSRCFRQGPVSSWTQSWLLRCAGVSARSLYLEASVPRAGWQRRLSRPRAASSCSGVPGSPSPSLQFPTGSR